MNKNNQNLNCRQEGFGMIMVLVIAAILLVFAAMAAKVSYSLHRQNQKEKIILQKKADLLKIVNVAKVVL
jgi:hypothetical protein